MPTPCSHPGCDRLMRARGFCRVHYRRDREGSDMDAPIRSQRGANYVCSVPGCGRYHASEGLCGGHLYRKRQGIAMDTPFRGEVKSCSTPGCERPLKAKGFCPGHYSRYRSGLDTNAELRQMYEGVREGCLVPNCNGAYVAMGLCRKHTNQRINYSLSVDEIVRLSTEGCSVCRATDNLHIDHDHECCPVGNSPKCGKCIRGVLCRSCNLGIGLFQDDPDNLRGAATYLDNWRRSLAQTLRKR